MIGRSRLSALAVRARSLALRARCSSSRFAAWLRSRLSSEFIERPRAWRLGLRPRLAPRHWNSNSNSNSISISISISNWWVVVAVLAAACGGDEPVTDPAPISVESPFRYPIEAWDADIEGEVVVMVHVTDVGGVDSVYVLESSGRAALDAAALAGARQLKFAPARRGDDRIAMWAKLPVRFAKPDSARSGGEE